MYSPDDHILSDIMAQTSAPTPFDLGAMLYGQPPPEPPGAFTPGMAAAPPAAPIADVSPQPTLAEDDLEKRKADWRAMQGSGQAPAPGPSAGGGQKPQGSNLGSKLLGIGGAAAGTAIGGPIGGIIGGGFGSLIGSLL